MTLGQETRWAYSTMLPNPDGTCGHCSTYIKTPCQPTGRFWVDNAAATTHCRYHRVNNQCLC